MQGAEGSRIIGAARTDACYRPGKNIRAGASEQLAFAARISRSNEGLDRTGQHSTVSGVSDE